MVPHELRAHLPPGNGRSVLHGRRRSHCSRFKVGLDALKGLFQPVSLLMSWRCYTRKARALASLCTCSEAGEAFMWTNHGRKQSWWFLGFLWYSYVGMEMCSELEQCSWELSDMQGGLRRLKCYLRCLKTTDLVESEYPPDAYSFVKQDWKVLWGSRVPG